jgi:putative hydrolase of HD superfamily
MEKELVDFFIEINKLKDSKRYSTSPRHVPDSSADHSWKLALMTITFNENLKLGLDSLHCVKLALTHDICEYLEGDIDSLLVRKGVVSKEKKREIELKAMTKLEKGYSFGRELRELWEEFEEKNSPESKYVNALDKIEALTHMIDKGFIGNSEDPIDLLHTAVYADKAVADFPRLTLLLNELKFRLKQIYKKQGFEWKPEYE